MSGKPTEHEVIDLLARALYRTKSGLDGVPLKDLAKQWSALRPLQRQIYTVQAADLVWLVDSLRSGVTPYPFRDEERDPST